MTDEETLADEPKEEEAPPAPIIPDPGEDEPEEGMTNDPVTDDTDEGDA